MWKSGSFEAVVKDKFAMAGNLPAFWEEQKSNKGKFKQNVIEIWMQSFDISKGRHRFLLLGEESISEVKSAMMSQLLECSP